MVRSIPKEWQIFIIEGQFTNSKIPSKLDKEIIKEMDKRLNVRVLHRDGMEFEVRNKYLEQLNQYEFALMMDSDEYIEEFNHSIFTDSILELEQDIYLIDIKYGQEVRQQGRFFVIPTDFRYFKSHKYLKLKGRIIGVNSAKKGVKGIVLRHDDSSRPKDIKNKIEEYQKKLWKYEDESVIINA